MTSWIVAIDKTYPQHWTIAAKHGFWDMTKNIKIEAGDSVFFWLSGKSLVSHTIAASDARPWRRGDVPPWEDSGARVYRFRFTFRVVSEEPVDQPSWGSLQAATGVTASPHFGPNKVTSPEGEAWLAARFAATPPAPVPDVYLAPEVRIEVDELLGHDLRERALRAIALRQGQPAFRAALIEAYAGMCAVTGYRTESVLEAAHISPYLGDHTNIVANGLLLRADIHTLFDRKLLTVTPEHEVRVAPALGLTPYAQYDGQALAYVPPTAQRPSTSTLATHNASCEWFGTPSAAEGHSPYK